MTPGRGDVWLVDLGAPIGREQAGRRAAVVVSSDLLNGGPAGVVVVVPLTTSRRDLPLHVEIDGGHSGLNDVSYAKCEDVRSVSDRRLMARLGRCSDVELRAIGAVLSHVLDLDL